jgi:hypothetical protein
VASRYALLVGSEHPIAGADSIARETVNSNLDAISEALTSLGTLSFGWTDGSKPKRTYSDRNRLLDALESFPDG